MSYHNKNLIRAICEAIVNDIYDETEQKKSRGDEPFALVKDFVLRNIKPGRVLEIGAGCGESLSIFPITDIVEPCNYRRAKISAPIVYRCFSENLDFGNGSFDTVLMLDTFDQVRSVIETVAEVNRVLKKGGVFIFDCRVDDSKDIVYGLVYGFKNLRRYLEDFGFQAIECRIVEGRGHYAMEKIYDWSPDMLRKLQLVEEDGKWIAKNFYPDKDFHRRYL